jgi:hypothetical protein
MMTNENSGSALGGCWVGQFHCWGRCSQLLHHRVNRVVTDGRSPAAGSGRGFLIGTGHGGVEGQARLQFGTDPLACFKAPAFTRGIHPTAQSGGKSTDGFQGAHPRARAQLESLFLAVFQDQAAHRANRAPPVDFALRASFQMAPGPFLTFGQGLHFQVQERVHLAKAVKVNGFARDLNLVHAVLPGASGGLPHVLPVGSPITSALIT